MNEIKRLKSKIRLLRIGTSLAVCGFFVCVMAKVTPVTIICTLLSCFLGMCLYHQLTVYKNQLRRTRRRIECLKELSEESVSAD